MKIGLIANLIVTQSGQKLLNKPVYHKIPNLMAIMRLKEETKNRGIK